MKLIAIFTTLVFRHLKFTSSCFFQFKTCFHFQHCSITWTFQNNYSVSEPIVIFRIVSVYVISGIICNFKIILVRIIVVSVSIRRICFVIRATLHEYLSGVYILSLESRVDYDTLSGWCGRALFFFNKRDVFCEFCKFSRIAVQNLLFVVGIKVDCHALTRWYVVEYLQHSNILFKVVICFVNWLWFIFTVERDLSDSLKLSEI